MIQQHTVGHRRQLQTIDRDAKRCRLRRAKLAVQGLRDLSSQRSPGYQSAGVLTAQIRLPDAAYTAPELRAAVVARMLAQIRALPRVIAASTTQNAFVPGFSYQTLVNVKDRPTPDRQPHTVQFRRVSTDYFKTMQITVVRGRPFVEGDVADQPLVAIVSRQFAERLLPAGDRVGQILLRNIPNPPPLTVVGVVDDVFDVSVTQAPEPTLYLPWRRTTTPIYPSPA